MSDAVRVRVRYDTVDENGETRRERNDRFGETSPALIVPASGQYLWDWYFDLSTRLRRVRSGVCEPIPPTEFMAWKAATGRIVYPSEYAILSAIDVAYCDEMNKELKDYRDRQTERIAKDSKRRG